MPNEEPASITLSDVGFAFHDRTGERHVLRGVDFSLARGEVCALIGRSGVGKSTLLRIMAGQLAPGTGSVRRAPASPDQVSVLYHPQEALLLPWETVTENARLGLRFTDLSATMPIGALLEKLDLAGLEERHPSRLSGGQIERVALARTLLTPADTYLLDEPLSGTDYPRRIEVENFLVDFIRSRAATAMIVTHDVPQAVAVSDRVHLLAADADSARAITIMVPEELRAIAPASRRSSPAFGPFVQQLVDDLGAGR